MEQETTTLPALAEEYTKAMKDGHKLGFLVGDIDLQIEKAESLTALKQRFKAFKAGATDVGDERAANVIFHMQCGLNAMISFLTMWVELKKGNHQSAWNKLIDAEEYLSIALRAADGGVGVEDFLERLRLVEQVVFPIFTLYNSVGQIICGGKCTICDKPFNSCEHVEGRVYWGRLCSRAAPEIVEVDHVALVDEPRDRRCIITEISGDDGHYRDYMSGKITRKIEPKEGDAPMTMRGIIFRLPSIEIY